MFSIAAALGEKISKWYLCCNVKDRGYAVKAVKWYRGRIV
jgi:hypothetical protein